jgi:hypothetical protein
MNNAFLIQYEESRNNKGRKTKVDGGKKKVLKEFATLANTIGDCTGTKEEFGPN